MAYPQEIVDYTRSLFLEIDENGKPAHQWKEIVDLVNKRVGDKTGKVGRFSDKVLTQWVNKFEWDKERKELKARYAKQAEAAERKEQEAIEAKAKRERNQILDRGATTLELGRMQNKKAFDALHGIIEAKIYFTGLYYKLLKGEQVEYTREQIEERMLSPQQETYLYKILADRAMDYDKIVADNLDHDHELEVTINVVDKTKEVKQ